MAKKLAEHRANIRRLSHHLSDEAVEEVVELRRKREKKREAERAERREAHEARMTAQAERRLKPMKARAKVDFVKAGGNPFDFEAAWPEIRERLLADAVVKKSRSGLRDRTADLS